MTAPRRAIFLRPSLGIGGAERWAVDAALALQARGWSVEFVVNSLDLARTQPEVIRGQITVTVLEGLPAAWTQKRLRVLCAMLGQWMLLRRLRRRGPAPDLFVCDLVPHVAAAMRRWFPRSGVLVYCHYPDRLAVTAQGAYALYRAVLGRWEDSGMRAAHRVLVNSRYTAEAVRRVFPFLSPEKVAIVPPGVRLPLRAEAEGLADAWAKAPPRKILSLARFDPSKNVELAIDAFADLGGQLGPMAFTPWRLVLAGSLDSRRPESLALVERLRAQAAARGVLSQIEWVFDPAPAELDVLWRETVALVHCARAEHFGIVLIEAMARGLPVLAVGHGGPQEIVVDGITGALRPPQAALFASVLAEWIRLPGRAALLGAAGRERVAAHYASDRFAAHFAAEAERTLAAAR